MRLEFRTLPVFLVSIFSGSQSAPTPQPSQISMEREEVRALVESAVNAAVSKSLAKSGFLKMLSLRR